MTTSQPYGQAYVFTDIEASKEAIEAELPTVCRNAQTPSGLELSVREVKDLMMDRGTNKGLFGCGKKWAKAYDQKGEESSFKRYQDLKYVIEAKYPNATNEQAAAELTDISGQLYNAFHESGPYYAEVVAKAPNGQYSLWLNK